MTNNHTKSSNFQYNDIKKRTVKPSIYPSNYSSEMKKIIFKEVTLKCSVNEIISFIKFLKYANYIVMTIYTVNFYSIH